MRTTYYVMDHKTKEILATHLTQIASYKMVKELTHQYHDTNRFRRYVEDK